MSKAILKSIEPKVVEEIVNGGKKILVSKTAPKLKPPFKVYVYCTNGSMLRDFRNEKNFDLKNKFVLHSEKSNNVLASSIPFLNRKVVAEITCDRIKEYDTNDLGWYFYDLETCFLCDEIAGYGKGKSVYDWHISNLKVYDIPKSLYEFTKPCPEMSNIDHEEICKYCYETNYGECTEVHTPNGVDFCEGRWCEKAYEAYREENYAITRPPKNWQYVEELC